MREAASADDNYINIERGNVKLCGQFHQPDDAKHKCDGSYSLVLVGAVQLHQQKYAQLY